MTKPHNKTTYRIAVVGPKDIISGFQALGIDTFHAENSEEALDTIKNIRRQTLSENESENTQYGIIMVIDELLRAIPTDEYDRISKGALPALLSIPSITSDKEAGTLKLRRLAEKAIGSNILG